MIKRPPSDTSIFLEVSSKIYPFPCGWWGAVRVRGGGSYLRYITSHIITFRSNRVDFRFSAWSIQRLAPRRQENYLLLVCFGWKGLNGLYSRVMCFKYFAVCFNHPRTKTSSLRNLGSGQRSGKTKGCRRERNNGAAIFKGIIYEQEHHVILLSWGNFFRANKKVNVIGRWWRQCLSSANHISAFISRLWTNTKKLWRKRCKRVWRFFKIQARMWRSLFLCSESYIFLAMNSGQGHRKAVETYNASQRKWVDDMVSACSVCFFTRMQRACTIWVRHEAPCAGSFYTANVLVIIDPITFDCLQILEKQEVDRVEFIKKQIMLYVFLRKEVNEICEKVTSLSFNQSWLSLSNVEHWTLDESGLRFPASF